jgi:hypothetical protein
MKLTKEILDSGEWLSESIFKINNKKYTKMICEQCGEYFLIRGLKKRGKFCSHKCYSINLIGKKHSEETIQKRSDSGRGKLRPKTKEHREKIRKTLTGKIRCIYSYRGIPKYDLYVGRLEPYEECKRSKRDPNILRVRCTYCGKWYIPTISQIENRFIGINNNDSCRFYCSSGCKTECPIFGKHVNDLIKRDKFAAGRILPHELNREVQPELRQLVFMRDNYTCQKCGVKGGYLHCHHFEGVEQNPIESADVDNCITFCKDCHGLAHKEKGCRRIDLRKCKENNQTMVVI